ncbi:hypothetical protein [Marinitenerispora sediminis]|uniref:hypothetical protein n=1 Tax=Marinitenerispora sediminis TaxID=1931232 RepID=UPI0015F16263|nr:hypothetical protein [Marinitenerispora sediminis]
MVRLLDGALPFLAEDERHGITVASDDLDLFDAALGAEGAGIPSYVRPYLDVVVAR